MARILPLAVGPTIWRIRYPFPGQGWEIQRQGQLFFLHLSVPASEVITTPAVKQDPVFFFLFSFHRDSLCCSVTLAIRFARTRNRDHSDQKVPQVCTVISRGGVRDTRALVSSYPHYLEVSSSIRGVVRLAPLRYVVSVIYGVIADRIVGLNPGRACSNLHTISLPH